MDLFVLTFYQEETNRSRIVLTGHTLHPCQFVVEFHYLWSRYSICCLGLDLEAEKKRKKTKTNDMTALVRSDLWAKSQTFFLTWLPCMKPSLQTVTVNVFSSPTLMQTYIYQLLSSLLNTKFYVMCFSKNTNSPAHWKGFYDHCTPSQSMTVIK